MSKHTKGPWHVWAGAIYQGHDNDDLDGQLVILSLEAGALMDDIKAGEWDDHVNAKPEDLRLAAAAPELLEALQSIAECCDEDHAARDYLSRQTEIRGIARAAIAKATGEQP